MTRALALCAALGACLCTGCSLTGIRQATRSKVIDVLRDINPLNSFLGVGLTLFALLIVFIIIDSWLGGDRRKPENKDSPEL